MVCAQKQGRMMSIFARNMTRSAVEQEAKLLFSYVQEREAFHGRIRRRAPPQSGASAMNTSCVSRPGRERP
jgi:hypothetical protein